MYPALTDLLVTFRCIHIKIEELYNNSYNSNAIYIYTYSNDFLFSHSQWIDIPQRNFPTIMWHNKFGIHMTTVA